MSNGRFEALKFLHQIRQSIDNGSFVFRPRKREKTYRFLLDNDLSEDDVIGILKLLSQEDHPIGPENDHDGTPGSVMKFIYQIDDLKLYIKLKLCTEGDRPMGFLLSFHEEGHHND